MPSDPSAPAPASQPAWAGYLLRLGDSHLVLGHRLSEWCGHGPVLEEDIALTNLALDCLGHAGVLLRMAGQADGSGRSEDELAYFREAVQFRNVLLVEQPNGDFARTIARQFLFTAYTHVLYGHLLRSANGELAGVAAKFSRELQYHLRHVGRWMLVLGDGTPESHARLQTAVDELWSFTAELFMCWPGDQELIAQGLVPDPLLLQRDWSELVQGVLAQAGIAQPAASIHMQSGGPLGRHTEHLGYLLATMQIVARSFPGASW